LRIKMLPLEHVQKRTEEVIASLHLEERQATVTRALTQACPIVELDHNKFVREVDYVNFITNFIKAWESKDASFLLQKRGVKVDKIVDIEEFINSRDYMNQTGSVRPAIMLKLNEFFASDDYIEGVLTGAIGIGKNYFTDMAMAYMLYKLSCYENPQLEFDLAPGSTIFFIAQSKTYALAKKVVFDQFAERLRLSPYFTKNFRFDPGVKSELRFPNQIVILPVGGNDTAALGMNVFGGVIDELNFMARTRDSVETRFTNEDEYDQAERLYSTIIRRMKSRFMQKGKLPGRLMLISSRNYPGDFTSRKIEEAKVDKSIFVMCYSQWEALPADRFEGEKFLIEVGNELKQSRIIKEKSDALDEDDVVEVPIEYKTEFERDIDAALRDLGGIAVSTRAPFIPYRELLQKARDSFTTISGGRQLFSHGDIILPEFYDRAGTWDELLDEEYVETVMTDKTVVLASHIDVGLSGDALGLAIGRISGYKSLPATKFFDGRSNSFVEVSDIIAPIYHVDGVLRIKSKRGEEVDLEMVRDFVLYLRSRFFLKWCTMDSYQAPLFYQAFRKVGIRSGVMSVDTSIAPYTELKLAVKEERILMPEHEVLAREIREVERDKEKDKIDHLPTGSKDCSDAVAGVVFMLRSKEARYGSASRRPSRSGEKEHEESSKPIRKIRVGMKRQRSGFSGGVV